VNRDDDDDGTDDVEVIVVFLWSDVLNDEASGAKKIPTIAIVIVNLMVESSLLQRNSLATTINSVKTMTIGGVVLQNKSELRSATATPTG
jgi:hypothetical protein